MKAHGSSIWTPAWDGERAAEPRSSCPRPQCGGWVMALGRQMVCTELACSYSRARFDSTPVLPASEPEPEPAPVKPPRTREAAPRLGGVGSRTRSRSAAVLELVRARPWISAAEIAEQLGCPQEACHLHLGREHAGSVDRQRIEKGGPWRYAMIGTAVPKTAGGPSLDLTTRSLEVLAAIVAADHPLSRAELGERVGLSQSRVTHYLALLLAAGLVVEGSSSPPWSCQHRRTLTATEAGRVRVEPEVDLVEGPEPEQGVELEVDLVEGPEPEQGVELEVVAGVEPDDDAHVEVEVLEGAEPEQGVEIGVELGVEPEQLEQLVEVEITDAPPPVAPPHRRRVEDEQESEPPATAPRRRAPSRGSAVIHG